MGMQTGDLFLLIHEKEQAKQIKQKVILRYGTI